MAKRDGDDQHQDQEQGQQENVQVMKTKDGSTMIQTGPDSVQINGTNYGGIHQSFSN